MNNNYNFRNNLIKLSTCDDIDTALNEWKVIKHNNKNQPEQIESKAECLCQKLISNVYTIYNIKTDKFAYIGTSCYRKFCKNINKTKSEVLKKVVYEYMSESGYRMINDLDNYSSNIKIRTIERFENLMNNKTVYEKIKELNILIHDVGYIFLNPLLDYYTRGIGDKQCRTCGWKYKLIDIGDRFVYDNICYYSCCNEKKDQDIQTITNKIKKNILHIETCDGTLWRRIKIPGVPDI